MERRRNENAPSKQVSCYCVYSEPRLVSKVDGVTMRFDSLRAASVFLGRNKGYLSNIIKSGRTLDNYEIVVGEI